MLILRWHGLPKLGIVELRSPNQDPHSSKATEPFEKLAATSPGPLLAWIM